MKIQATSAIEVLKEEKNLENKLMKKLPWKRLRALPSSQMRMREMEKSRVRPKPTPMENHALRIWEWPLPKWKRGWLKAQNLKSQ